MISKPLTIISLVTVGNPNVKLASAPISVNEDILLVANDVKNWISVDLV